MSLRRAAAALLLLAISTAVAQDAVRPDVGKPLQAAQEHLKAQRFKDALAKVREADGAANKSAAEQTLIERMRLSAALGAGDSAAAERAFDAVGGRLPQPEQLKVMESLASSWWRAKDLAKAAQWAQRHLKEGGSSAAMRQLLLQAQYESGDFAGVARTLQAEVAADEKAGRAPAEQRLQLLAYSQQKLGDNAGYAGTIEKLVAHHPKPNYWADLIDRVQRKPGFSARYALDIYRLRLATGNLADASDYMEMAQLALQAGHAGEAKRVVDQGIARGVLGKGADAERHRRLAALVDKQLADDAKAASGEPLADAQAARSGDALVALGERLAEQGDAAQGVKLIEQGIAKGALKRPGDALLRLGIAQLRAGQKAKAQQTLRGVKGSDGSADIARLWLLQGNGA